MESKILHHVLITDEKNAKGLLPEEALYTKNLFKDTHNYMFWDKILIEKFINNNFNEDVVKAFKSLKPYSYKADLAKYCILYVYGGWYVDVGIKIEKIPSTTYAEMVIFRDLNNGDIPPWQIVTGLMYSTAYNPIFLKAIQMIVDNCKNQYYGYRTLSQTGPELFGKAMATVGWDHFQANFVTGDFVFPEDGEERKKFVIQGETFALYKKHKGGETGIPGTNNYNVLFGNRDIYEPWE